MRTLFAETLTFRKEATRKKKGTKYFSSGLSSFPEPPKETSTAFSRNGKRPLTIKLAYFLHFAYLCSSFWHQRECICNPQDQKSCIFHSPAPELPLRTFPSSFHWKAIQSLCKLLSSAHLHLVILLLKGCLMTAPSQIFTNHFSVFTSMQHPSTLNSSSPTVLGCSWGYLKIRCLPETYLSHDFGFFEIFLSIPHFHHHFLAS